MNTFQRHMETYRSNKQRHSQAAFCDTVGACRIGSYGYSRVLLGSRRCVSNGFEQSIQTTTGGPRCTWKWRSICNYLSKRPLASTCDIQLASTLWPCRWRCFDISQRADNFELDGGFQCEHTEFMLCTKTYIWSTTPKHFFCYTQYFDKVTPKTIYFSINLLFSFDTQICEGSSSASFLAEVSVSSPRKLFIFII